MPNPTGRPVPPPPKPMPVPPPPMPRAVKPVKHGMGKGPALLLATILGIGLTELVTQGRPVRALNRINPIHRMSQFRVLGNYLSHIGHKTPAVPVKPVTVKPQPKIEICDSKKPYPKEGSQWCLITADALEQHCNPDYKPGLPGQHQAHTWPGEGDPIGPNRTRITQWENCDRLNSFNKAITGQSSPGQVAADANDALHDIDPNLDVGKLGKVMPYISGSQHSHADNPPFDGRGSDPQIQIPAPPADQRQPAPVYRVDPNQLGAKPIKQPPAPATAPQ